MNAIYSWQKLELLLAANLVKGDVVGCLTFDDAHLPETREQVRNKFKWFLDKLRAAREERGQNLVMFWSIEHLHGEGRWHIHIACNATGSDYEEMLRLWGQGECEFNALPRGIRKRTMRLWLGTWPRRNGTRSGSVMELHPQR